MNILIYTHGNEQEKLPCYLVDVCAVKVIIVDTSTEEKMVMFKLESFSGKGDDILKENKTLIKILAYTEGLVSLENMDLDTIDENDKHLKDISFTNKETIN